MLIIPLIHYPFKHMLISIRTLNYAVKTTLSISIQPKLSLDSDNLKTDMVRLIAGASILPRTE